MSVQTTVNVNCDGGDALATPGAFLVLAFYSEVAGGHAFGPFASREAAEKCAHVLAGRAGVVKASVEEVG